MIQQVVSRSDAPKHFPDVSGGSASSSTPSGRVPGTPRCGAEVISMNPKKHTRAGLVRAFADPLPFHNRLCRSAPARQSASVRRESSCRLAWRRSNEQGRHSATRQRADARDQMQDPPRILCRKQTARNCILVAAIIPSPQLPREGTSDIASRFSSACAKVCPKFRISRKAGFALIQRNDSRLLRN